MKKNKSNSKTKKQPSNKKKNTNKKISKEELETNSKIVEEEINTNVIKNKKTKERNKTNKKYSKKNDIKNQEELNLYDNEIIPNAVVIKDNILDNKTKLTKEIEEEKIDSLKENQKDEFKIAKYFSQENLIEPKNTSKDLLFLPEEEIILSLCDGKLYSLNILSYKIISTFSIPKTNIISFTFNN